MKKRFILLFSCLLLLSFKNSKAQDTTNFYCGTDSLHKLFLQQNPKAKDVIERNHYQIRQFRKTNPNLKFYPKPMPVLDPCPECLGLFNADSICLKTRFVLPVVVHVIHSLADTIVGTNSNISESHVIQAMESLNKSFSGFGINDHRAVNTGIQFFLAPVGPDSNGIVRYTNTIGNIDINSGDLLLDLIDEEYKTGKYINLFVVDALSPQSLMGYATLPGLMPQCVVVRRHVFGDYNNCIGCELNTNSRGKTTAHEMGHYLNLLHTFHGGCAGMDSIDCDVKGDGCCDTPPVKRPNTYCPYDSNTCHEFPDLPDQIENFMDYTNEECSRFFTKNQAERMIATLNTSRRELTDLDWVNELNPGLCLFSARFKASKNLICDTGTVYLRGYAHGNPGIENRWTFFDSSGGVYLDTIVTNGHTFVHHFSTPGIYDCRLQLIYDTDTAEERIDHYFWVTDCDEVMPNEQANWFFGEYAGLKFTQTGTRPSLDALFLGQQGSTITTAEGCISISDSLGNLMYYGGGREASPFSGRLYDKVHDTLNDPNTSLLHIHGQSAQNSITFPCPFDTDKMMLVHANNNFSGPMYYTLLESDSTGIYKLVPGTLNTPMNIPGLFFRTTDSAMEIREYITAAPKCNGIGYWLAVVGYSNQDDTMLSIISIDFDGIKLADTLKFPESRQRAFGQAKFSPDGTKLALMNYVYDFDRFTGKLSLKLELPPLKSNNTDNIYGLSFSPNSRYLYWIGQDDEWKAHIYRINLAHSDPLSKIEDLGFTYDFDYFRAMQLGPDNRIYISNFESDSLGIIRYPDKPWNTSESNPLGYEPLGVALQVGGTGGISHYGLPNMVDAKPMDKVTDTIYAVISNCNTVSFSTTSVCYSSYIWLFGDGDTSHQKQSTHEYLSYGQYLVKLVLDLIDTLYFDLDLLDPSVHISGASQTCELFLPPYQAIGNFSNEVDYTWEISNGTLSNPHGQPDLAYLDFEGESTTIKVTVKDHIRDCETSDSMTITYNSGIENNSILSIYNDYLYYFCPSENITNTGSTPTGGNDTFAYQWFVSYDSLSYQAIEGQTSKNLSWGLKDTSFFVYREVLSNGCQSRSNKVKYIPFFKKNKIKIANTCYNGNNNLDLTGNFSEYIGSPYQGGFLSYIVEWKKNPNFEFHNDTIYNLTDSSKAKFATYTGTTDSFNIFHRVLRTFNSNCIYKSNEIKVYNPNYLNTIEIREEGGNTIIASKVPLPTHLYSVTWEKKCINDDWEEVSDSISSDILGNISNFSCCQLRRRLIPKDESGTLLNCDTFYSNSLLNDADYFSITTHPSNYHSSGYFDTAIFEIAHSGGEGTQVQWQISKDGGENWTDIQGATGLIYKTVGDKCSDDYKYRAKVINECQTEFSESATHMVSPGAGSDYFLWLKDLPNDVADEPHTQINTSNYLFSPDIQPSDYHIPNLTVWPRQHVIGTFGSGASIYVHTKIRNNGTDTSQGGKLYLYASRAGMHPEWNFSFTDQLQIHQVGPSIYAINHELGIEINDTGIYIPPIPPGGEEWITYYWTDAPSYLTGSQVRLWSNDYDFDNSKVLIYLARIETCEKEPFDMTYPELKYDGSNIRTAFQNIRNNARVAALHSELTPMKPQRNTQNVLDRMPDKWNTVESDPYNRPYRLEMNSDSTKNFFQDGEVYIYFDDNLWDAWINGGSRGSGFVVVEDNVFKISNLQPVFWDSMTLDQDSTGHIGYSLHYKPAAPMTGGMQHEFFRFSLHVDTFELGEFWLHTEIQTGMEGATFNGDDTDHTNESTSLNELESTPLVFSARPNPFSNELKIFVANFSKGAVVTLYDMNGKKLNSQPLDIKNKEQVLTFQTNHLAEGIYFVHYQSSEQNTVKKVVLVR
jgi:hypothetical protein